MCFMCAGVVTPRIFILLFKKFVFLYKLKILSLDVQAIHKLKINFSNILATRHAIV